MPPWQAAPPQLCLHVSTVKVSKTKKGDVIVCQTFSGEFPKNIQDLGKEGIFPELI